MHEDRQGEEQIESEKTVNQPWFSFSSPLVPQFNLVYFHFSWSRLRDTQRQFWRYLQINSGSGILRYMFRFRETQRQVQVHGYSEICSGLGILGDRYRFRDTWRKVQVQGYSEIGSGSGILKDKFKFRDTLDIGSGSGILRDRFSFSLQVYLEIGSYSRILRDRFRSIRDTQRQVQVQGYLRYRFRFRDTQRQIQIQEY